RDDPAAVGGEVRRADHVGDARELAQLLAGLHVPEAERLVGAAGDEPLGGRGEGAGGGAGGGALAGAPDPDGLDLRPAAGAVGLGVRRGGGWRGAGRRGSGRGRGGRPYAPAPVSPPGGCSGRRGGRPRRWRPPTGRRA